MFSFATNLKFSKFQLYDAPYSLPFMKSTFFSRQISRQNFPKAA